MQTKSDKISDDAVQEEVSSEFPIREWMIKRVDARLKKADLPVTSKNQDRLISIWGVFVACVAGSSTGFLLGEIDSLGFKFVRSAALVLFTIGLVSKFLDTKLLAFSQRPVTNSRLQRTMLHSADRLERYPHFKTPLFTSFLSWIAACLAILIGHRSACHSVLNDADLLNCQARSEDSSIRLGGFVASFFVSAGFSQVLANNARTGLAELATRRVTDLAAVWLLMVTLVMGIVLPLSILLSFASSALESEPEALLVGLPLPLGLLCVMSWGVRKTAPPI